MRKIRNRNNPLSGMAYFNKEGELFIKQGIKYGGQMRPAVTVREWFYLLWEVCVEEGLPKKNINNIKKNWLGSRATQYRNKDTLKNKGYL
jgi:hypothetical protein